LRDLGWERRDPRWSSDSSRCNLPECNHPEVRTKQDLGRPDCDHGDPKQDRQNAGHFRIGPDRRYEIEDANFILHDLLAVRTVRPIRALDAEFFETVLQRAEGEAQEFRRFRDVVVRLLHRLRYQVALDVFEVDPLGW